MNKLKKQAGLTLIELLVALVVLALMSGMAWRGLDGVLRAYGLMHERQGHTQALHWSLRQWQQDWAEAAATGLQNGMAFDGQTLRLVRRYMVDGTGQGNYALVVVAWRVTPGPQEQSQWIRWESVRVNNPNKLQEQWALAAQWGQSLAEPLQAQARVLTPATSMQLQFWEGTAWANALTTRTDAQALPLAAKLVLQVPEAGQLTMDWVNPSTVVPKAF
jgi:general secretion pathway protein J